MYKAFVSLVFWVWSPCSIDLAFCCPVWHLFSLVFLSWSHHIRHPASSFVMGRTWLHDRFHLQFLRPRFLSLFAHVSWSSPFNMLCLDVDCVHLFPMLVHCRLNPSTSIVAFFEWRFNVVMVGGDRIPGIRSVRLRKVGSRCWWCVCWVMRVVVAPWVWDFSMQRIAFYWCVWERFCAVDRGWDGWWWRVTGVTTESLQSHCGESS